VDTWITNRPESKTAMPEPAILKAIDASLRTTKDVMRHG